MGPASSYLFCQSWLNYERDSELPFSSLFRFQYFSQWMSFAHLSLVIDRIDFDFPQFAYCYSRIFVGAHAVRQFEIQLSSVFLQRLLTAARVQYLQNDLGSSYDRDCLSNPSMGATSTY